MGTLQIINRSPHGGEAVGFLAEMQREAERRRKAEEREYRRQVREHEKAVRDAERQAARNETERKKLHADNRAREAERLNSALEQSIGHLESLLVATLKVDDHIDLEALKQTFVEPPFDPGSLGVPLPEPELEPVRPPSTFGGLVPGAKAKYQAAVQQATQIYEEELAEWQRAEQSRQDELALARAGHEERVEKERQEVEQDNSQIDDFEAKLEAADPAAIVDYLGMVLDRSRYPEDFPNGHKLAFVPESKQVVVEHDLPSFDVIPEEKGFKYVKSRDGSPRLPDRKPSGNLSTERSLLS